MKKTEKLDGLLLQLTAKKYFYDCITRSFAPKLKVSEDPVCGSGHCHVIPFVGKKDEKKSINRISGFQKEVVSFTVAWRMTE